MQQTKAKTEKMEIGGYLQAKKAAVYIGVGRTKFLYLSKEPDFPKPIRLSDTLVLYKVSELDEYLESKRG